ncbi:MAG: hypothetical protein ACRCSV_03725 [Chlamydiales bacterium]
MSMNTTKQICWYCEGNVSIEAQQCCFCGSELSNENNHSSPVETDTLSSDPPYESQISVDTPLDESLARFYKPPYLIRERFATPAPIEKVDKMIHVASDLSDRLDEEEISDTASPSEEVGNSDALSLLLLSLGAFLLTLGLLLFFFEEEGSVTLQWNTNYWFIYCFLSFPALYFGFRYLGKISKYKD